jgi:hypothetical protein
MAKTSTIRTLYESLQKRLRPEDVADLILTQLSSTLTAVEKTKHELSFLAKLERVARGSTRRSIYQMSSMLDEFRKPIVPERQVNKAVELFTTARKPSDDDLFDPEKLLVFLTTLCKEIRKKTDESDFKAHRLNNHEREKCGLDISRRRYNKLFRFLVRFQKKIGTYALELRKYRATMVSKSSLASLITYEDFAASRNAAYFIAYFTAKSNKRSVFTNDSQERPFDEIAEMLLNRFKRRPCERGWKAIAHVMPDYQVVENLSDADKMDIFSKFLTVMVDMASLLKMTYETNKFDLKTMIVHRGNDSSTWNIIAGAWNASRHGWVSLLYSLGLQEKFEAICPGKVMRLMAADVVRWHQATGGKIDPNTGVWADLPLPWEVFNGEKTCTREIVEAVCKSHGIDAVKTGWVAPKAERKTVAFTPTPELVHGVVVSNPKLAAVLRKAGWFSGKSAKPVTEAVVVERDYTGAALKASVGDEVVER